jgi:uncharacterized membrane protein YhhN
MTPILTAAALCALAYLVLTTGPVGLARSLLKTGAVALLALVAYLAQAPAELVAALGLCALGDWLLSRGSDRSFIAGIGAFAAGHLAYVALFLTWPGVDPARIVQAPGLWMTAALIVFGLAMAAILAPRAGGLRGPVLAYVPVILSMGLAALALPAQTASLALPAALAFIASDTVLAAGRFLLDPTHPAQRVAARTVWILYWGAQAGFLVAFT